MISFFSLLKEGEQILTQQFPESAEYDTEHILKNCFCLSKTQLLQSLNDLFPPNLNSKSFFEKVKLRETGVPLDYILESSEFRGRDYIVKPGVLIPRPETELVVEKAIEVIKNYYLGIKDTETLNCYELGLGTGVISIELGIEFPNMRLKGWDTNILACDLSRENALKFDVLLETFNEDFFLKISEENWGTRNVFISNPPYIPSKDIRGLDDSVKNYEPISALDGGLTGLDYYERCFRLFYPKKVIQIYEIGFDQKKELETLLKNIGYSKFTFFKDYQGCDRGLVVYL